jgi:endonuclease YncB( thermonuclease family)
MGGKPSLGSIDTSTISDLPQKGILTKCRVIKVHDGDTMTIVYLIDRCTPFRINLRMEGIDAPEINTKRSLERATGLLVTRWLISEISKQKYWWVYLKRWDKYGGRVVGTLHYTDSLTMYPSLNKDMLNLGIVSPYQGGKKEEWTDEGLMSIMGNVRHSTSI